MAYKFDGTFSRFTEINFILFFIILIHFLEENKGYDVEKLMEIFQKSDTTIRAHLRKLGELQWIKKEKPFGSQKDYFTFDPWLFRDLESQDFNLLQFGRELKRVLMHLFHISKKYLKETPPKK